MTPATDTKWIIFASLWNGLSPLSVSMYYISRCLPHSQLPSQCVKSGAEPDSGISHLNKASTWPGCSPGPEWTPQKKGKEEVKVFLFADYMIVHKNHPKGSTKIILELVSHRAQYQYSKFNFNSIWTGGKPISKHKHTKKIKCWDTNLTGHLWIFMLKILKFFGKIREDN